MSGHDRKEDEVRRMLEGRHPALPPDVVRRAAEEGRRLLRRRRAVRAVGWALLVAVVVAFCVWAAVAEPWAARPAERTPPLRGW
ncbi:hypothetical protein BLA24_26445 [Streptomyces cinnamoneus]|uniref:DUF3040 domain-containing protein n=1 Tax=Streptomyces cinnamoneus TaxID=53446 RepID=A0A2G1XEB0_STRCJ|nr:hypothetical protein [Streptomyces cinnamoneus]PHQ49568.1 hypothetical protein BLA24_26445 [Streptomyces cinnamoneus]PPT14713.1 hypothetical protein CYQ11_19195 [Streptomyces cinnamoneus]